MLTDKIATPISEGNLVLGVLFDCSKAFDTVDHSILPNRLYMYGSRGVSSQSSHHPQEVLLAQFSLYVHKGGLKPDSFHFISKLLI